MFLVLRKHVTYINVVLTMALVFAMTGGAYAASKYLITSTKQISPKVLKQLKGARGLKGASGPAGPQGPAGPVGARGETGAVGKEGEVGKEGKEGQEGKEGVAGKEGSPWTAGGILPSGQSETGVWSVNDNAIAAAENVYSSISFTIPLSAPINCAHAGEPCQLHYIGPEEGEGEHKEKLPEEKGVKVCSGNFEEPHAAKGNLCAFAKETENTESRGTLPNGAPFYFFSPQAAGANAIEAAGTNGTLVTFRSEGAGLVEASGTWVVTAE